MRDQGDLLVRFHGIFMCHDLCSNFMSFCPHRAGTWSRSAAATNHRSCPEPGQVRGR
jgi:hypothetical protein